VNAAKAGLEHQNLEVWKSHEEVDKCVGDVSKSFLLVEVNVQSLGIPPDAKSRTSGGTASGLAPACAPSPETLSRSDNWMSALVFVVVTHSKRNGVAWRYHDLQTCAHEKRLFFQRLD
jgi:hypothetical protein